MSDLFSSWSVVELMGHRRIVGNAEEVEMAGGKLLRVDVPEVNGSQPFSQFYGAGAIYCLSPISEATAMAMLARTKPEPWFAWDVTRQLKAPAAEIKDDYDGEEDDADLEF